MKISFEEILVADCFTLPELKTRAITSTKSPKTKHYRVLNDGAEIAFLSLDRWSEPQINSLVLYEIFVPRSLRKKGIASAVLAEVELLAKKEGFQKIRLRASPLDSDISSDELIEWYAKRGYNSDRDASWDMEKLLS